MSERKTCPRCDRPDLTIGRPGLWALSRHDNETYICNSCGTDEAMRDLVGRPVWEGYPDIATHYLQDSAS